MKDALSGLNLPTEKTPTEKTPTELDFDDDYEGYSSGNAAQDVWDFISNNDDDDDYSSDKLDGPDSFSQPAEFGAEWFISKCSEVLGVLTLDRDEDEVQSELMDLIGFDDLDFIIELLAHRSDIVTAVTSQRVRALAFGSAISARREADTACGVAVSLSLSLSTKIYFDLFLGETFIRFHHASLKWAGVGVSFATT
ncbi:hypothetical protein EDB81DRAFT_948863 [Dactylonectria macrodidyma]|uniref:Brr2 N-terminal helicase PWI domain-containing protein n=1 Tax=Dactylonectria macrodidyma TaxID=307937 RepID=A0A9P9EJ17_9HYPO|nr:hypothetical protein EDB81DRAFT_948863 [Dactylonectria macrodidyma]